MVELFKGYIATRNKVPLQKFKDTDKLLSLEEAQELSEYAGVLAEDTILIDIDDYDQSEILMDIVEDLQLNCRVLETTRGKHFYFKGDSITKCGTHLKLAVGLEADIKVGSHNSISILKFDGKERPIIYDIEPNEAYSDAPAWLTSVKTKIDFLNLAEGEGRNQTLFNYILTLQGAELSNDDIKETIKLLNKYVLSDPLDDSELKKILRAESFQKPVFYSKDGKFLFNRFATYLKNNNHIKMIDDQLHIYSGGVYKDGLRSLERAMIDIIPTLSSRNRNEVLKYLNIVAPEVMSQAGSNYIAFNNGIYNLTTDKLEDFRPEIIVKNKIPHNYNYEAYNENMDSVLDKLSCNDEQIRDLLEEVAGFCLFRGGNTLRKAFIMIGDKANGKSTYLDCLTQMVGEDNTTALDLKELGDRFRTSELFGKLICAGDDIGDEFIPNPAVFKKVVSGDPIVVERKGQDPFTLYNYAKCIFSANNIPRINDKTGAVLDRLLIIPFNATFSKEDPDYDPFIKEKLRTESAMEYLIQVALDGLKRVLKNNSFTISEKVQAELNEYNENNNPIIGFLRDLDLEADVINQPTGDVYAMYKVYCNANGYTPIASNTFGKYLKKECGLIVKQLMRDGKRFRVYCNE